MERFGLEAEATTAPEITQACGMFEDAIANGTVRHLGQSELLEALEGAGKCPVGDAWALSRNSHGWI